MLASILRPVALPPQLIGRPAPCDIFDARGTLLQRVGSPVARRAGHSQHPPRVFCEASQADCISSVNPLAQLRAVGENLAHLAAQVDNGRHVAAAELTGLARELRELWALDADACIGYARLHRFERPSVCHAVLAALLAAELAAANGSSPESITDVVGAALTMNLAAMALHDRMFEIAGDPGEKLCAELRLHPVESARLLERIGGIPDDWLQAVAQHHENADGSGYPCGVSRAGISLPARILRVADTLAAQLIGHKTRPSHHWNMRQTKGLQHLIQHVFGAELELLDHLLVRQLMTRLSAFPPGSLVRLSSGELAVVNRRQPDTDSPRDAMVFIGTHGRPLEEPRVRRIGLRDCRIRSYVQDELPKLPPYEWQLIWGYR